MLPFSIGINNDPKSRPSVSKVAHKAFLEVNEEGAEAAAATMVEVADCEPEDIIVVADHPFLLLITHNGAPTFIGRVANPTKA